MFSAKGDTVLDPFLGSGTTTKIAIQTGRNSTGYELDETLVPLIEKKISSGSPQKTGDCKVQISKRSISRT